jgi:hypothetical protein
MINEFENKSFEDCVKNFENMKFSQKELTWINAFKLFKKIKESV